VNMQFPYCVQFQEAIDRLRAPYRHVICEHYTKGKRLATIAAETRRPSGTIRTWQRRALKQLARDPGIREVEEERELL
jgi:DNA-directed RNA polymerase specialized sigma24 family protein